MPPADSLETTVIKHGFVLDQHGQALKEIKVEIQGVREELKNDIHEIRQGNGDVAEMFGQIMSATTHTANQVVALNSTLSSHTQQVDSRFTELRLEQDKMCALKHGAIEQRLGTVEQGRTEIARKIEDMSENSKVFYIRDLESKLKETRTSQMVLKSQKFEWNKFWVSAGIGIIMLLLGSAATYVVTVSSHRATSQPPAATSK